MNPGWTLTIWALIFFALGYSNAWLAGEKKAQSARRLGQAEGYMKRVDEDDALDNRRR